MLRPFRSLLPTVHPSAHVDVSAQIIGDVYIGAESSVWTIPVFFVFSVALFVLSG